MSHTELKQLGQQVHQAGVDLQRMLLSGRELQATCQRYLGGQTHSFAAIQIQVLWLSASGESLRKLSTFLAKIQGLSTVRLMAASIGTKQSFSWTVSPAQLATATAA